MDPNMSSHPPVPADPIPEVSQLQSAQPAGGEQSYVEIIASSMTELLNKANADDAMLAKITDEMEISQDSVKTTLSGLLGKIAQGTITKEELALIMTAPVLEENQ